MNKLSENIYVNYAHANDRIHRKWISIKNYYENIHDKNIAIARDRFTGGTKGNIVWPFKKHAIETLENNNDYNNALAGEKAYSYKDGIFKDDDPSLYKNKVKIIYINLLKLSLPENTIFDVYRVSPPLSNIKTDWAAPTNMKNKLDIWFRECKKIVNIELIPFMVPLNLGDIELKSWPGGTLILDELKNANIELNRNTPDVSTTDDIEANIFSKSNIFNSLTIKNKDLNSVLNLKINHDYLIGNGVLTFDNVSFEKENCNLKGIEASNNIELRDCFFENPDFTIKCLKNIKIESRFFETNQFKPTRFLSKITAGTLFVFMNNNGAVNFEEMELTDKLQFSTTKLAITSQITLDSKRNAYVKIGKLTLLKNKTNNININIEDNLNNMVIAKIDNPKNYKIYISVSGVETNKLLKLPKSQMSNIKIKNRMKDQSLLEVIWI